jgi:dipeptidyl aminopeptidase/acylaminoacyl peptidase
MSRTVLLFAFCLILALPAQAQDVPSTDIWLMRLANGPAQPLVNLTDRPGYDNQPAFTPDGKALLYTAMDSTGQTDIYRIDLGAQTRMRLTHTAESEYSATPMPSGGFSVIRVEGDGTQRLWRFADDGTTPSLLLTDIKPVGYHAWGDTSTLALFVLGDPPTLLVADRTPGRADTLAWNIGRSLHKVPGTHAGSFVQKSETDPWRIQQLDLGTRAITTLAETQPGREDYAWLPDGSLLMSDGTALYGWPAGAENWKLIADLSGAGFSDITRLAISPDGAWLALVAAERK